MPAAPLLFPASFSRIQITVPLPASSGLPSSNWNSKRRAVPTARGFGVRIKIPPLLTSIPYRSINWSRVELLNLILSVTGLDIDLNPRIVGGPIALRYWSDLMLTSSLRILTYLLVGSGSSLRGRYDIISISKRYEYTTPISHNYAKPIILQ